MIISASDRGIRPGKDVTRELIELFKELETIPGDKTLEFLGGTYRITARNAEHDKLFVTNTVGDDEWNTGEEPHYVAMAMRIKGVKNLTVKGNGAVFVVDGQADNLVISECENLVIDGIEFRTEKPDLHEFKVIKKSPFRIIFETDADSDYIKEGSNFAFVGTDYKLGFFENRNVAFWTSRLSGNDPDELRRVAHPMLGAISIEEISKRKFKVKYLSARRFNMGDRFYVFDAKRKHVGIFIEGSKNICLRNIMQRFNYSLALVAQDTENITIDAVDFAPEKDSPLMMASLADFVQICMCKGDVKITDSNFVGAGDDTLNVHGIHFEIKKIDGNRLEAHFMHSQTHGFCPLHAGDEIEYIDRNSLLTKGKAVITDAKLISEKVIELKVSDVEGLSLGDAIEDVTMCPNFYYTGNTINRIVTRGMLITTRGKVVIENNDFINTGMKTLHFSNDAKNWYESGRVLDVTIRNNRFGVCPEWNVSIKPENSVHRGAVHSNFLIENNVFSVSSKGIFIKSADNVCLKNNIIPKRGKRFITAHNASNVTEEGSRPN